MLKLINELIDEPLSILEIHHLLRTARACVDALQNGVGNGRGGNVLAEEKDFAVRVLHHDYILPYNELHVH